MEIGIAEEQKITSGSNSERIRPARVALFESLDDILGQEIPFSADDGLFEAKSRSSGQRPSEEFKLRGSDDLHIDLVNDAGSANSSSSGAVEAYSAGRSQMSDDSQKWIRYPPELKDA